MKHLKEMMYVFSLFIISVCLVNCEKKPIYDSIEQQWIIKHFVLLDDNRTVKCENLYLSITHLVTEVAEKTTYDGVQDLEPLHGYGSFIARTTFLDKGKILTLTDFKMNGYNTDIKRDATEEQLRPFGINNPKITIFKIIGNSHDNLILESDYARLYLKRF